MVFEKATIQDINVLTDLRIAYKIITMLLEDATVQGVSVIELKATEDGYLLYKSVGFEDVVTKYHNMKIVLK